jgi:hypothetical protein
MCGLPEVSFIFLPFISVAVCAIASIVLLVVTLVFAVKSRPRKAASILLALIAPILLWWPINWAADCVHLGMTVGFGARMNVSGSDGNGFAAYDWSVGFAGGPSRFLIHDETDEIALPIAQHTHPLSTENGFGEDCAGKVNHLLGHYYICSF